MKKVSSNDSVNSGGKSKNDEKHGGDNDNYNNGNNGGDSDGDDMEMERATRGG